MNVRWKRKGYVGSSVHVVLNNGTKNKTDFKNNIWRHLKNNRREPTINKHSKEKVMVHDAGGARWDVATKHIVE